MYLLITQAFEDYSITPFSHSINPNFVVQDLEGFFSTRHFAPDAHLPFLTVLLGLYHHLSRERALLAGDRIFVNGKLRLGHLAGHFFGFSDGLLLRVVLLVVLDESFRQGGLCLLLCCCLKDLLITYSHLLKLQSLIQNPK